MIIYSGICIEKGVMRLKILSVLVTISFLLISGSLFIDNPTTSPGNNLETLLQNNTSFTFPAVCEHSGCYPPGLNYKGECKLIMAVANATAGDYNLLLKVRDPARPGLQVLCTIPEGYEYDYHHPWTGLTMHFTVEHGFIGTTTKGDVPPNITKPGMMVSDAGLAFGDADTFSYLVNPSKNAWDDFDWMRYAAQSADDVKEASMLLTHDIIDGMHAPSIAENIFVIGPDSGVVVEADAFNYRVKEVDNVAVQSNYPKDLWDMHVLYPLFVARDFNSTFTGWVEDGQKIQLGGCTGLRITDIGSQSIIVRLSPIGMSKQVALGDGEKLGNFYIRLLDIQDDKAELFVCFQYFAWESKINDIIEKRVGDIRVKDMMNWSRIHSYSLDGLRGICQGGYEAATIYRIPVAYPQFLSSLWFAADQCSSIFAPVHICAQDIYDPYETGEAHLVALQLLEIYGHSNLTKVFEIPENAFIAEVDEAEREALHLLEDGNVEEAINLLTLTDTNIQTQVLIIEKMWLNMSYLTDDIFDCLADEILDIWEKNRSDIGEVENALNFISSLLKEKRHSESDIFHLGSIQKNLNSLASLIGFKERTINYLLKSETVTDNCK